MHTDQLTETVCAQLRVTARTVAQLAAGLGTSTRTVLDLLNELRSQGKAERIVDVDGNAVARWRLP